MDVAGIKRRLRFYGFHFFRHTAGSILYDRIGRTKLVQRALSHSREQITADTYIHVAKEVVGKATNILAGEIFSVISPDPGSQPDLIN
jgi:integrase